MEAEMGTKYVGNRIFHEENGKLYSSITKEVELDTETYEPITKSDIKTTVVEVPKETPKTGGNTLQCPVCKWKAPFEEALASHMNIHAKVKK
jgi:hypothetical protein